MKRALIVIGVQNEYVTGELPIGYPELEESLAAIGSAMEAAAAHGVPIAVIQHSAHEEFPIFARGSQTWQLHDVVRQRPYDKHIEKSYPSCFTGTDLDWWLLDNEIDTITLAGYLTQNCVESTAREASHRGLAVEVLSDATGTLAMSNKAGWCSAEQLHKTALVVLQSRYAAVATTGEWRTAVAAGEELEQPDLVASTELGRAVAA